MRAWLRIFLVGLGLWVATVAVTFLTGNPNLIPTLVLTGSFLVPVTFVAWAFQRRETTEVTPALILNTFITGGALGVIGASVLESYLLHPSAGLFVGVGFIEEGVKLAALAFLTRRLVVNPNATAWFSARRSASASPPSSRPATRSQRCSRSTASP
jgi:RsiW-degrading membrane proteinase PrsW (M82 family)